MNTLTLLNGQGDVTIGWEEKDNERMKELIAKKMKEGYSFFILKKKAFGLFSCKEKLTSIQDIPDRKVYIQDKDIQELCSSDTGLFVGHGITDEQLDTTKRAETVEEVVQNDSVAIRPIAGG